MSELTAFLDATLGLAGGYLLPLLAILAALIFVHELGHYWAARWAGVGVRAFAIGFGPRLAARTSRRTGTEWRLCALPLGGYVKLIGEDPSGAPETDAEERAALARVVGGSLTAAPRWKRAVILLAGVTMNALAAAALFYAYVSFAEIKASPATIAEVAPNSPAKAAGILPGDRVTSVNGREIDRFEALAKTVRLHLDDPVRLVLERDGRRIETTVVPELKVFEAAGRRVETGLIGVRAAAPEPVDLGAGARALEALKMTRDGFEGVAVGFWQVVSGERAFSGLMGVIGMGHVAGLIYEASGWVALLEFAALISLSLAFVNLLPVPVMDGGQLVLLGVEKLRGRDLSERAQKALVYASLAFVGAVFLATGYNDVAAIVRSLA